MVAELILGDALPPVRWGVGQAIFTHCGSEIVRGDARAIVARVRALGVEHGLDARVAHDGLTLVLKG